MEELRFSRDASGWLACGCCHTFAVREDGTVVACGSNFYGQLGLGDGRKRDHLTDVPVRAPVAGAACGGYFTYLRFEDGSIDACGTNSYGQLGLGASSCFLPVPVPSPVAQVSCGMHHVFLLFEGGSIAGCGRNRTGQLGLGDIVDRSRFVPVGAAAAYATVRPVLQVACGSYHTFLRYADGLECCGEGSEGQLGLGDRNQRNQFTTPRLDHPVASVACGGYHTFVLFQDGLVAATGYGCRGQLGLQDCKTAPAMLYTSKYRFCSVPSAEGIEAIVCGTNFTFLRSEGGAITAYGANACGQLGLRDRSEHTKFSLVPVPPSVEEIACGENHSIIRFSDGRLAIAGYDNYSKFTYCS